MFGEVDKNQVFVFGSNANRDHVGGAAKLALDKFGANRELPWRGVFKPNVLHIKVRVEDLKAEYDLMSR